MECVLETPYLYCGRWSIGVEEGFCRHKRRATIVVHISQYGLPQVSIEECPLSYRRSHQPSEDRPSTLRTRWGAFVHNSLPNRYLSRLPCVYVTTSKLYETDHGQIKTEVAKAAMVNPGIHEKMRIELVVIRERLGTKTIDFKGKGRLDLN
jgi:hypothetical protein